MARYKVSAAKVEGQNPRKAVKDAVELLGGMKAFVSPGDTVVIKPNMFLNTKPEAGKITHPLVVIEVAKLVREAGALKVTVAERNFAFRDIFRGFEEIYDLADVVNLDNVPHRLVTIPGARNLQHPAPVPTIIDEADVFIGCPGLRMHALSRFSNGLKNMMGIMPVGNPLHIHGYGLEESYLDLNRYRTTDLVVSDAFIALEGNFPSEGDPRRLDIIFASNNPLASDFAACKLLGIDPETSTVIAEAKARGIGPVSAEEIEWLGAPPDPPEEPVVPAPNSLEPFVGDFNIIAKGECYACRGALTGGLTAVKNGAPELYERASGLADIVIGPDPEVKDSPFHLYYGTCANRVRKEIPARGKGIYIPGCPPLAGFVRLGLAAVTARPEAFVFVRDITVKNVDSVLSDGFGPGVNYIVAEPEDPRAAGKEIKRLLNDVDVCQREDWQAVVLSRNGLSTDRGLRFLQRIRQEASLSVSTGPAGWKDRFHAGLDIPYLTAHANATAKDAEQLIRRLAFISKAIVLPEKVDEALIKAVVEEHYSGLILCEGDPGEAKEIYEGVYRSMIEG